MNLVIEKQKPTHPIYENKPFRKLNGKLSERSAALLDRIRTERQVIADDSLLMAATQLLRLNYVYVYYGEFTGHRYLKIVPVAPMNITGDLVQH